MREPRSVRLRCAIYTRKSTEEGLDQAFNSLDAQREACEAFAKSQVHEGWQVSPTHYDDGGFSGGTMARPGLSQLLEDIEDGLIDIVIVYKVDRLSRSLADFVRLIERFDEKNISFVSVTQQFNTSTSMGRLTLNVLLSFAQFEREVTSERIRDKIAASKAKGMWMGGTVPLGYDRVDKQLIVNPEEADTVRHIFDQYLKLGCVRRLKTSLDLDGYRSKARPNQCRTNHQPFSRGALYTILKNPIYIGKIQHKGELHNGLHDPIVKESIWTGVQDRITRNRHDKKVRASAKRPSLLAGLLMDDRGNPMSPTYTKKANRHYRYYVSQAALQYRDRETGSVVRVPADEVENVVIKLIGGLLRNPGELIELTKPHRLAPDQLERVISEGQHLINDWRDQTVSQQITVLTDFLAKVVVDKSSIRVEVDRTGLVQHLLSRHGNTSKLLTLSAKQPLVLTEPVELRRSGIESKYVFPAGDPPKMHDRSVRALQLAVLTALRWNEELTSGASGSMDELVEKHGLNKRHFQRLKKLAFLSPEIIDRIIKGDVSDDLTLETLKMGFPEDWAAQAR